MNKRKKLPIGIESFEEMRKEDFYYVDKTRWIEQLLAQWGKVNLFTRPRRFGKSLNTVSWKVSGCIHQFERREWKHFRRGTELSCKSYQQRSA